MPQQLHVLCCYACKMYQVDIVKKSKKWQCKVCNEKQSVQTVYFQGSGKECRACVQKLNTVDNTQPEIVMHIAERINTPQESKWTKYLDSSVDNTESIITKATASFNIDYKQTIPKVETSEHLDIDYTVADDVVINESHGETNWYSHQEATQDVSIKSDKAYNIPIDCQDKLNKMSQYNAKNMELEKDKSATTIKKKSIFDNSEDIDCTLDF